MSFNHFKRRRSELPEINLIPMMDVLMTVLTFFIIISMTLTGEQIASITLPQAKGAQESVEPSARLILELDLQGQMAIEGQSLTSEQVTARLQSFLRQQPDGLVVLKADHQLDYRYIREALQTLKAAGGDRLSLAIGGS